MTPANWIALGPVAFIIHDSEEIATIERWLGIHRSDLPAILQPLAFITTREVALAVAGLTVGFILAAVHGVLRARRQQLSLPFLIVAGTFVANGLTHPVQALWFRGYTPGVVTALLVVLPYGVGLARSLIANQLATRRTIVLAVAAGLVLQVPLVLLAMSAGRA